MRFSLRLAAAIVAVLLLAASVPTRKLASDRPSPVGSVVPTSSMANARSGHTATLLPNGKVLIAGGMVRNGEFLADSELYDPATGKFTTLDKMSARRVSHTATLLPNGKILIAGGIAGRYMSEGHWMGRVLSSAELFDPAKGTFTRTGSMATARNSHAAILLPDGKVLILGGSGGDDWRTLHASAELYDPATGTFGPTGPMSMARIPHAVAVLKNGKVLVAGGTGPDRGVLASAELYDPATSRFASAGNMTMRRHKHAATLLADGRVLITGGSDERDWNGQYPTAELYDPRQGTFTASGRMNLARFKHMAATVLLPNGKVLVAGGGERADVYDPATRAFSAVAGSLDAPWHFSTATLLPSGEVLIVGGYGNSDAATPKAWLYQP